MSVQTIPISEAVRLEGISREAMKKRIQRRAIPLYPDKTDCRRRRFPVSCLSTDALLRWGREKREAAESPESTTLVPASSGSLFSLLLPAPPPLSAGTAQDDTALERWRVIAPVLNGDWESCRDQRLADGREIQTKTDFVEWLAAQNGLSPNTIWEWRARYLKNGLPGLRRQPRADKGKSHVLSQGLP